MRDVGRMGESAFCQWCASAGLTANSSNVDKTGWDFIVEFGFARRDDDAFGSVHDAALECKVQVKSTDKRDRKLAIKLSNLKRLVTSAMPSFFVFIEFDGLEQAQRVFLVHVDQKIAYSVLARLQEAESKNESHLLHKKMLTVKYDESNLISEPTGLALAEAIRKHVGDDLAGYISKKNHQLQTLGFEDGFAEITISTSGVDELKKLIDLSLGLEAEVEVAELVTIRKRFGMSEPIPWHREKRVKVGMPELLPTSTGFVKFKTDKLGPAFVFPVRFYLSPFNRSAPEELRKGRVAAQFFDWVFYPYTGRSNYTFSFDGLEFELNELANAIRFLSQFAKPGQKIYCELHLDGQEFMKFEIDSPGMAVDLDKECSAIVEAHRILSLLNIHTPIRTSLGYITSYASRINEMHLVLSGEAKTFRMEFELGEPLDLDKEVACISFLSVPIGNVWLGVFMVITGKAILPESGRYNVFATTKIIERVVVRNYNEELDVASLVAAATAIEEKYMAEYDVVTLFNKEEFS